MNIKWVIEDWDPEITQRLINQVQKSGFEYIPYASFHINDINSDTDCIITYTSLNAAGLLMRTKNCIPGPWLNLEQYKCSYYYAYIGKYLFNHDYIILSMKEFYRTKDLWFNRLGRNDSLFIRPDSGMKIFSGEILLKENFEYGWAWIKEFCDPESLIIISTPREILREWRFVIAENNVITGSMYKPECHPKWPKQAFKLAETVAKIYHPDPVYTLDICEGIDNNFYVLETGSFSCAGLYQADLNLIVKTVSEIALKEWKTFYEI